MICFARAERKSCAMKWKYLMKSHMKENHGYNWYFQRAKPKLQDRLLLARCCIKFGEQADLLLERIGSFLPPSEVLAWYPKKQQQILLLLCTGSVSRFSFSTLLLNCQLIPTKSTEQ